SSMPSAPITWLGARCRSSRTRATRDSRPATAPRSPWPRCCTTSGTIPSPTRSKRPGSHVTKRSPSATSPAASWPSGSGISAFRSASPMFKRVVRNAIAAGHLSADQVAVATDDGLIHDLMQADTAGLARRLRERRLAKRAVDLPATELPADAPAWAADDPELQQHVEDRLAGEVGLRPGELFLDFPAKPDMLA